MTTGHAQIDRSTLAEKLVPLAQKNTRTIVAFAGGPGAGKSTLVEALLAEIETNAPGAAAILPMDGYHYDDLYLEPNGLRPRKGAPETFDVGGLRTTLARLRADNESRVAVPVFDRSIEIARAGARLILPQHRLILVEGNYLLLEQDPWTDLREMFDMTVFVDVPLDILRARLTERWSDLPAEEARRKVDENDLPNARYVADNSTTADFTIMNHG
ncbi:nucleoside triphosphate hydrolase [Palleronia caenipelagi]|uniref:nucleoside triphosphate hydrolase n=1 Tax=Palleronia caenipelagi TaxID=2489174 RepID=UPI001FED292A|nr:nucleoside triphosphate hydrolase [Palleronia caenipelagi]